MICEAVHTRATQWGEHRAADSWMPRLSERKSGRDTQPAPQRRTYVGLEAERRAGSSSLIRSGGGGGDTRSS
eukprot:COSAG06_NODE_67554_length_251_cov_1.269737_1_plen_71_part_01